MNRILKSIAKFPTRLFLVAIGGIIFISFIGRVHLFDPVETRLAEFAREMLVTNIYNYVQFHFKPLDLTPPLFTWLQTASMNLFGINEFACRLPNAVTGVLSMILVFNIGRNYFSSVFGVFWALLLGSSFLSILYFKSGLSQPVGNYFVFLSAYFLFNVSVKDEFAPRKMMNAKMFRNVFYSALFCSLAMITTGAINFLIVVLLVTLVLLWNRGKITFSFMNFFWWFVFQSLFIFAWLNVEDNSLGVAKFFDYAKAQLTIVAQSGTSGIRSLPLFLLVLLIGLFPSSFLIWRVLKKNPNDTIHQLLLKRWMLALLLIIFGLIYFYHQQFLHQITLAFYPLSFLGAYFLHKLYEKTKVWKWSDSLLLVSGGLVWAALVGGGMYVFISGKNERIHGSIFGYFLEQTAYRKVYWNQAELLIPLFFLVGIGLSVFLFHRQKTIQAIGVLLTSCMLFFNLSILSILPKIDLNTQAPLIDFVKQNRGNFEQGNFETYIPAFYGSEVAEKNNSPIYKVDMLSDKYICSDSAWEYKQSLYNSYFIYEKK